MIFERVSAVHGNHERVGGQSSQGDARSEAPWRIAQDGGIELACLQRNELISR